MKKINFALFLSLMVMCLSAKADTITSIFFDIEAIFQTDSLKASSYVGKFDSIRYLASAGHLPRQEDLFKQLKPIKALSTQVTYNKNMEMPLIFSDWLSAKQSPSKITDSIEKYFKHKDISEIEKTVLLSIVDMMLTANSLADIQYVSEKMEALIEKLKSHGYKLYLVGNWAHISSLKSAFRNLFRMFNGVYVSGDLHELKPHEEFYEKVLELSGTKANHALWIETESKFVSKAHHYGYKFILYNHDQHEDIIRYLHKFGVRV